MANERKSHFLIIAWVKSYCRLVFDKWYQSLGYYTGLEKEPPLVTERARLVVNENVYIS